MCGILSVINNDFKEIALSDSLSLMNHRGPDNKGQIFIDGHYFGHQRLSILDLNERSNQPMEIGNFIITYNGEVYNYKELIKDHGLQAHTSSDTEVVVLMYQKYRERCVQYFNGMFAFVIYNKITKDVFVARDRLGIKPLYYKVLNNQIIYSSEISSILSLSDSPIDEFGIRQYRKFRMTINNHTVYKDINFFPAGYYSLNDKLTQYWDLDINDKDNPDDEEIEYLIQDSINIRKRADVELGSYLSGGLDSTILSFLLAPHDTWTVGFADLNEFDWSLLANKSLKSNHHQILVSYEEFLSTLEFMINKRNEPLSVPNEVLIYLMTKRVKEKNTVVLSGEGADELFWGYDRIFSFFHNQDCLSIEDFDDYYCYGSQKDNEVIDYAFENMKGDKPIDKIAYFFQKNHLHGLLRRLDNSTMLCSVEARVPFVDHRLIELVAGTTYEWRTGNRIKEPLKRIYGKLVPNEIIERKKVGFPVPLENIFLNYYTDKKNINPFDKWLMFNLESLNRSS